MIAVIGATGQIGSWLTQCFRSWGEPVIAVHRRTLSPRLSRYPLNHRIADLRDRGSVVQALAGCDSVINLAVEKSGYPDRSEQTRANALETENLVEACRKSGVARLVHMSSIAVLPPRVTPSVVGNPFRYSNERDGYTRAKIAAERVILGARKGLDTGIVRGGIVYGPYLWWSAAALQRCQASRLHLPSDSESRCYAVDVLDVVRLLRHLVHVPGPLPELLYAVNPEEASWTDFYSQHCSHAGIPFSAEKHPYASLRRHAQMDPANLQKTVLGLAPVQRAFDTRLISSRIGRLYRIKQSMERIRSEDGDGTDDGRRPLGNWWPSRSELELHSSSGAFREEDCGGAVGFRYSLPLSRGCEDVGAWWKFELSGMTPMERKLLDGRYRLVN